MNADTGIELMNVVPDIVHHAVSVNTKPENIESCINDNRVVWFLLTIYLYTTL